LRRSLHRPRDLWPPLRSKVGVINLLNGDSGKDVNVVIQQNAGQPLIGPDLADALNGI
jgi:hypothetical protein